MDDSARAHLVHHGADRSAADATAVELFCLIEGAFLLCRTTPLRGPLRIAGRRAAATVAEALAPAASGSRRACHADALGAATSARAASAPARRADYWPTPALGPEFVVGDRCPTGHPVPRYSPSL